MLYDETTQTLFVSAAWPGRSMKLVVIDEPNDAVITTLDISTPKVSPFREPGAIYNMKLHGGKVYFLASATNRAIDPGEFSIFASYDIASGQYEEYISRSLYYYYDYVEKTLRDGGPSDGFYTDFDFEQNNQIDGEFVMVSDVILHTFPPYPLLGWGSLLKGNATKTSPPDIQRRGPVYGEPLGRCETFGGGGFNMFYSYLIDDMDRFIKYSVSFSPNSPNVSAVYVGHYGVPPLDFTCNGYGDIFYGSMYADNKYIGTMAHNLNSVDATVHARLLEIRAEDKLNREAPLPANTAQMLSSNLILTTIPPHIHTKITQDGEPAFRGGLKNVLTSGNDLYLTGLQLDAGETVTPLNRNRIDLLLLTNGMLRNLSHAFSVPRSATAIALFGDDVALLAGARLYIVNKDAGVKYVTPFTFDKPVSLSANAEAGIVAVGSFSGVDVLRFKADKLITEFEVKPDSKIVYPYSDGPEGTEAEAKINFTLAQDANITLTIEKDGTVVKTLLEDEPFEQGAHTFEAVADKKGDGIIWKGSLDLPAIAIMVESFLGRGILIAPDGRYKIKMTAQDISGSGLPQDTKEAEIEVRTQ